MPTEHEYKYMISMDVSGRTGTDYISRIAKEKQTIKQGYLSFSKGTSTRVRCITDEGRQKWSFTYKQKVGDRVIEIEKKIDERDGNDLWSVCIGKLEKDRYVLQEDNLTWEVDFFKNGEQVYFVLAEVELAEGAPRPANDKMPSLIKNHILYEVALDDDRFSSKKLSDVEFATNLYSLFKK